MFKFIVLSLLISSCLSAPQNFVGRSAIGSHNSQILRSPFGTHSHHSKTVSDLDGTAVVHRHHTQNTGGSVLRVSRPQIVRSGPFAVRALPAHSPFLVGGPTSTPVISTAPAGVASNLFQTADGRIFAFSNGNQRIAPGQLFQTPDGRIFTTSVIPPQNQHNQVPVFSPEAEDQSPAIAPETSEPITETPIIEAVRDTTETADYADYSDDYEEVTEDPIEITTQPPAPEPEPQQQQQQQQRVVITQDNGLRSFLAVPSNQIISRAPFGPIFATRDHHAHATHVTTTSDQAIARVVPTAPVTHVTHPVSHIAHPAGLAYTLADTASTGYFTYPGAGFAFQF